MWAEGAFAADASADDDAENEAGCGPGCAHGSDHDHYVGGQAILEGVMMRGRHSWGLAVRQPSGSIARHSFDLPLLGERHPVFKLPVVRGIGALWESLSLGIKALSLSANLSMGEGPVPDRDGDPVAGEAAEPGAAAHGRGPAVRQDRVNRAAGWSPMMPRALRGRGSRGPVRAPEGPDAARLSELAISMVLALVVAVGLFIALPLFVAKHSARRSPTPSSST